MRRIRRRGFLLAAGALAAAALVRAWMPAKMPALGILTFTPPATPQGIESRPLTARLKSLGWVEGRNFRVDRVIE